jgi:hypothetical protein
MERQAEWLREMASWLPAQVRVLGYSASFRGALADLVSIARAQGVSVREVPAAFGGQEGEEALYEFGGRLTGLLEVAERGCPDLVGELEEVIRDTLRGRRPAFAARVTAASTLSAPTSRPAGRPHDRPPF